jgi:hypothetical protein
MNKQIEKLISQSFTDEQGEQFDMEKFAELLIKDILYNADMPLIDRNEVRRYYGLEQEPMPVRDIGLVTTTDWTK